MGNGAASVSRPRLATPALPGETGATQCARLTVGAWVIVIGSMIKVSARAGVYGRGVTRDRRLRVLTWNLHGAARPDLSAVAALLRSVEADVVALQEVRRPQAARLAASLGVAGWGWTLKHLRYGPWVRLHAEGLAMLLPEAVDIEDRLLSDGVRTWTARRRIAQRAELTGAGVRVVNAHLDAHDAGRRAPQAQRLAEWARTPAGMGCVVLGDLNARVDEPGVFGPLGAAGLRDAWDEAVGAAVASFTSPAAAPGQRIDHVLVGAGVDVERVVVPPGEWARWSDHLPVLADLRIVG
jgi:endonuclease/exonuclease/phosphatase family metal-dependent hydrolase